MLFKVSQPLFVLTKRSLNLTKKMATFLPVTCQGCPVSLICLQNCWFVVTLVPAGEWRKNLGLDSKWEGHVGPPQAQVSPHSLTCLLCLHSLACCLVLAGWGQYMIHAI